MGLILKINPFLTEIDVMPDYVYLLVEVDPQFSIHRLFKQIKGWSSMILCQEFPWLRSCYGCWRPTPTLSRLFGVRCLLSSNGASEIKSRYEIQRLCLTPISQLNDLAYATGKLYSCVVVSF